jgi:hypothetical protein
MNAADLMEKLLEIERTVGYDHPARVRALVIAAEESALLLQREIMETLRQNELLRQRVDTYSRASLAALAETRIAGEPMVH